MNERIDLKKILKDCPFGTKFYSTVYGDVTFCMIIEGADRPICLNMENGRWYYLSSDGRMTRDYDGECTLFPSREQRDWSKFTAPWLKKEPEHKFHEGDWVVYNNDICQIVKREEGCNKLVTVFGIEKELVNERNLSTTRLWTIQDARDGDVLCCKSGWMCIFKAINNHTNTFSSYCFMDSDKWFSNRGSNVHTLDKEFIKAYNGEIHPATKEQRDALMKAMNEAGYEWDAEKKELKKLVEVQGKFDPKTLKPFDRVLVSDVDGDIWHCNIFEYIRECTYPYSCVYSAWERCIPYNEETKHLVGTTEEAPEYYRYWEE